MSIPLTKTQKRKKQELDDFLRKCDNLKSLSEHKELILEVRKHFGGPRGIAQKLIDLYDDAKVGGQVRFNVLKRVLDGEKAQAEMDGVVEDFQEMIGSMSQEELDSMIHAQIMKKVAADEEAEQLNTTVPLLEPPSD